jgi:hypothetical protein
MQKRVRTRKLRKVLEFEMKVRSCKTAWNKMVQSASTEDKAGKKL